jgi:hypothetical protein
MKTIIEILKMIISFPFFLLMAISYTILLFSFYLSFLLRYDRESASIEFDKLKDHMSEFFEKNQ